MDVYHPIIAKTFEQEINSQVKGIVENQLANKRPSISNNAIYLFIGVKTSFEKDDVQQKNNSTKLTPFDCEDHFPL